MWLRYNILYIMLLLCSCASHPYVPDDDDGGGDIVVEPEGSGQVSIAYLKSLYERTPVAIDRDIYIVGRVVSSDISGNFYKTLVVEEETGGVVVRIDLENYYQKYDRGSLVQINCNSLVLSSYGGTLQLGAYAYDGETQYLGHIPAGRIDAVISVDRDLDIDIVSPPIAIKSLSANNISCTVKFTDIQFEERGMAWADEGVDTNRHIVDRAGNRLVVRTSAYAAFAAWLLPYGSGSIEGVVSYFNGEYQLTLCNIEAADMYEERF